MTCSHCGSDNPAGRKFCGDCGGALENRCPQCGAENPVDKKFCGECGAKIRGLGVRGVGIGTENPNSDLTPSQRPAALQRAVNA